MLAVIADSASLARSQFRDAQDFARDHGIPLRSIETHELEREEYAANGADRCFHCKDELFSVLEQELERTGFEALAYGLNLDDGQDFRPGHKAAAQHRVAAPLAEAGLTKRMYAPWPSARTCGFGTSLPPHASPRAWSMGAG